MLKKSLVPFLILGLVVSLLSTLIISRTSKGLSKDNLKLRSELSDCKYENERSKEKYVQQLFSENRKISNIPLLDGDLDTVSLVSIIDNTKLVYRFYEGTCVQCVEDELVIVKKLADRIGPENIVVIADFDAMNRLKAIIGRIGVQSPYFIYKERFELPIETDEHEIASFFLLDRDLRVQFVFKTGGDQDINDPYYERIISFYKKGN